MRDPQSWNPSPFGPKPNALPLIFECCDYMINEYHPNCSMIKKGKYAPKQYDDSICWIYNGFDKGSKWNHCNPTHHGISSTFYLLIVKVPLNINDDGHLLKFYPWMFHFSGLIEFTFIPEIEKEKVMGFIDYRWIDSTRCFSIGHPQRSWRNGDNCNSIDFAIDYTNDRNDILYPSIYHGKNINPRVISLKCIHWFTMITQSSRSIVVYSNIRYHSAGNNDGWFNMF